MSDLSPAAQAVLNAVTLKRYDVPYQACPKPIDQIQSDVSAALRAAADQLTPYTVSEMEGAALARNKLLAIATELEAQ